MKLHFNRNKPRQVLLSIIYRLSKLPFSSKKGKLKLFLKLNWIFWRLSLEQAEKIYGFSSDSMRRKNLEFLLNKLEQDQVVMDLGCRYGDISSIIAERTKSVIGIDQNKNAIDLAKEKHVATNLSFVQADAHDYLISNDQNFDVIILSHILEHLDDPKEFLNKFKSFFTYFYIEIPDLDDSYLNHYRHKVGASLVYTDNDHIWEFDRDSFKEILDACGLQVLDSEFRYGLQKYWCRSHNDS